jgi:hypothetical protein
MSSTDRRAHAKQERLESELHGYKTNLIKESIRMGHNDLGDYFYGRGDLQVCVCVIVSGVCVYMYVFVCVCACVCVCVCMHVCVHVIHFVALYSLHR